jgi:hypothetical protein
MFWLKEVIMNKFGLGLLLAAGLFSLDVSPASAHQQYDRVHVYSDGYRHATMRHNSMPRWLRHDRQFRRWYEHTPLRRYRRIGWNELYDIYRWERRYFSPRNYYKRDKHYRDDRRRRHRRDD